MAFMPVAHDTIAPMTEWRLEIMRGLETMEVMLVFLTDDFHGEHMDQPRGRVRSVLERRSYA